LAGRLQDAGRTAEQPGGGSPGQDARPCEGSPGPGEINALVALFAEGRHAEVAALAQEMTERFPQHGFGWKALGVAFKQMGRDADALAPTQRAATLSPGDAQVHCNLGAVLQGVGRLGEAEASYRRALQIDPDYADAYGNLGVILYASGRLSEAEDNYRRALQIRPDNAMVLSNLGAALQHQGRLDEAEASLRRALQISPDYAEAHNNLGNALKGLNRLGEAEDSFRRALQTSPNFADAHYNLGIILNERGRLKEAEASLQRALQIRPDNAAAQNVLNDILKKQGLLPDYLAPEVFDHANDRLLRRYFPRESDTFIYVIEIAGTCNLRCPSCPVGNSPDANRPKGFMDLDLFYRIVEKIKRDRVASNPRVWLFNWGEPLLHPKLPEMISALKKEGLYAMISTNLNTKKNLEEVIRSGPDEIKISLSGFSPETYSKTHVKGDIGLVKENMKLIRDFIDKHKVSTRVWVGHHVYRHNMHECDTIEKMCESLNFGYVPVQAFYQPLEKMMDLIEKKTPASEADFLSNFIVHPLDALASKRKTINNDLDCELRFNMTTINYDGSVALCCGVYDYRNMLGVNFTEASHDEIQALKYRHPLCKKCYDYGLQYSEPIPGPEGQ
jgi:tetratricopeptide (TPR) repeat protein